VFINGFNVGRYWPVAGPQITLYVPAGVLRAPPAQNQVILLELESSPSSRDPVANDTIEFVDKPLLSGRCFHTAGSTQLNDRRPRMLLSTNEAPISDQRWNVL